MKKVVILVLLSTALVFSLAAQTTIEFWHAMGGKNGEITQKVCDMFNASQKEYKVNGVFKGSYPDTMNAGIAAFRAGNPPAILQVYEVGTATMMSAKGAIKPVYQLMKEQGEPFDPKAYIPTITGYYSTSKGEMLSMPFNSSTSVMYYNKDAFKKAGLDPNKPPKTWPEFFDAAKKLKAAGFEYGFTTNWISWIQLENFSAWHNVAFGTKSNGFDGSRYAAYLQQPAPGEALHEPRRHGESEGLRLRRPGKQGQLTLHLRPGPAPFRVDRRVRSHEVDL